MLSVTCRWDGKTGRRGFITNPGTFDSRHFNPAYGEIIANADRLCEAPAIWLVGTKMCGLSIEMCDQCMRFSAFRCTTKRPINSNKLIADKIQALLPLLKTHRKFMRRRQYLTEEEVNALCRVERNVFCYRADLIAYAEHVLDQQEEALNQLLAKPAFAAVFQSRE